MVFMEFTNLRSGKNHKLTYNVAGCNIKPGNPRLAHYQRGSAQKNWMSNVLWRTYTVPVSLEESSSTQPEGYSVDEENAYSPEEPLHRPLSGDEVSSHFHGFLVHLIISDTIFSLL